jgi:hypothetical protein
MSMETCLSFRREAYSHMSHIQTRDFQQCNQTDTCLFVDIVLQRSIVGTGVNRSVAGRPRVALGKITWKCGTRTRPIAKVQWPNESLENCGWATKTQAIVILQCLAT